MRSKHAAMISKFRALFVFSCLCVMLATSFAEAARPSSVRTVSRVGVNDPRYAALVMDPDTGEIFHQQNANLLRHPASLTKVMTLYLLFEQLQAGKMNMQTPMQVSRIAAAQPRTNLALRAGTTIPVEIAIKSLIVQSANDVSVVVAEHIAGSQEKFAIMATNKARALGMRNTVYKNPNGLPNSAQVTTALEQAKLGIAIRRDFPKYYSYFSTRQFSWRGVNYYTHNRVMTRYSGTDGIKTGFINASGFNVLSSVQRGGRRLIGVVLGGASGVWRDDRMISLFSQGYQTLASRGNRQSGTIYAANLPLSREGSQAIASAASAPARAVPAENLQADRGIIANAQQQGRMGLPSAGSPFARINPEASASAGAHEYWGIQVGAFADREQAERAVAQAYQLAQNALQGSKVSVIGAGVSGSTIHRARLENLSEGQAKEACKALISNNAPCFIYRALGQSL
jgi:D-alanyl-D-alanine carboxypeptidase